MDEPEPLRISVAKWVVALIILLGLLLFAMQQGAVGCLILVGRAIALIGEVIVRAGHRIVRLGYYLNE